MPHSRKPADAPKTEDGSFLAPATLRQPAEGLGPRAQRTIASILAATREVFLTRGYAGTTVDEISRLANVSRASFYTYFPSKREVLLAVGADAASATQALIDELPQYAGSRAALRQWVQRYFDSLNIHGAFAMAWPIAAAQDEEIRVAGMRRYTSLCRHLGTAILSSTGRASEDPEAIGLVVLAMFERAWRYSELYREAFKIEAVVTQLTETVWSLARQTTGSSRASGSSTSY